MTVLGSHPSAFRLIAQLFLASLLAGGVAYGQAYSTEREVRVPGLRAPMARSHDPGVVLLTSLDILLNNKGVCCGKDSALADSAEKADPLSLKDVAAKLQGRHLLSDGRPIMVTATYLDAQAVNGALLIATLREKHALLLGWNSHLYVCYGVTYREDYDANGGLMDTVLRFRLIDPRYSDSQREVLFDRATDDWGRVQGMLWLSFAMQ